MQGGTQPSTWNPPAATTEVPATSTNRTDTAHAAAEFVDSSALLSSGRHADKLQGPEDSLLEEQGGHIDAEGLGPYHDMPAIPLGGSIYTFANTAQEFAQLSLDCSHNEHNTSPSHDSGKKYGPSAPGPTNPFGVQTATTPAASAIPFSSTASADWLAASTAADDPFAGASGNGDAAFFDEISDAGLYS